jgi:hypothetical protein
MDDVKVTSGPVARLEDPRGQADGTLVLKDGTRCTLPGKDPRFSTWARILKGARTQDMPVYLECGADGSAKTILPFAARRIEQVNEPAGEKAAVTLFLSPSIHHLRTSHRNYADMRALLEDAVKTERPVLLAVDPKTLEILAARKPEPGAKVIVL